MRNTQAINIQDINSVKFKLLHWAQQFSHVCFLDSNNFSGKVNSTGSNYASFEFLLGCGKHDELISSEKGAFEKLKTYTGINKDWLFGYFSYDLKNDVENLESNNADNLKFPAMHFFCPRFVITANKNQLVIEYHAEDKGCIENLLQAIAQLEYQEQKLPPIKFQLRISREDYIKKVQKLKNRIQQGDIYEINFCQELFAENVAVPPVSTYQKLLSVSPTPFSAFYKLHGQYIFSASPERYLKKTGSKLVSQPIKGTIRRGKDKKEDDDLIDQLYNDPKERSENVMIVDLVRNDLSRTASRNSVKVEELFGIYTFPQWHQMISTITSELKSDVHFVDAIKQAYPMGSMTGAPKISAMELIEEHEEMKRGVYSGSIGYITPAGDFDFNVIIRSLLYSAQNQYISFSVGGAITASSIPESEYEECLLKAKGLFNVFK